MNIEEAILRVPPSEDMQPEGADVSNSYRLGKLQTVEECLYVIAFLLHEVNSIGEHGICGNCGADLRECEACGAR